MSNVDRGRRSPGPPCRRPPRAGSPCPACGSPFALSLDGGVALGMWAAARRDSLADRLVSSAAIAVLARPGLWLSILLIVVFAAWLKPLPSAGMAPGDGCDTMQ